MSSVIWKYARSMYLRFTDIGRAALLGKGTGCKLSAQRKATYNLQLTTYCLMSYGKKTFGPKVSSPLMACCQHTVWISIVLIYHKVKSYRYIDISYILYLISYILYLLLKFPSRFGLRVFGGFGVSWLACLASETLRLPSSPTWSLAWSRNWLQSWQIFENV